MRVWDISPTKLCKNHLLGEHRELHAIWTIITQEKKGYSFHPETIRWKGKLMALYLRHTKLVKEMKKRGYGHNSPLNKKFARGNQIQTKFINSLSEQVMILKKKGCMCKV
ncbi:MAG: pyrimidine dimer DNA glycosylase [Thaumarchaeota archaeon]|nr:pyrimidine dimer DNA glycosylase [Nitrososphaerota archaeon]